MRISIITPSYNQKDFIGQTIDSVVSQDGDFELEYIIMDGGSNDGTVDLLVEKEKQINSQHKPGPKGGVKFIWKSKKDRGQSDAINQGLKLATGDIMAYLNSDDLYLPGALQKVVEQFEKQPNKIWLYGKCKMVDVDGNNVRGAITVYKDLLLRNFSRRKLLITNFISQPATFWARKAYQKVGDFDEDQHLVMDYDYWCKISKYGNPIVVDMPLAAFRVHQQNKSSQNFANQFREQYKVAASNTNNQLLLALHKIHNFFIVSVYKVITR